MNYAVLLYSNTSNPDSVPGDWPAEVKAIEDNDTVEAPWQIMTKDEYEAYITDSDRVAAKEAWNNKQAGIVEPFAKIIVTKVEDLTTNDPYFSWDEESSKIRMSVGSTIKASLEIQTLSGNRIPVNDFFAMPIIGENQPTELHAVKAIDGVISFEMTFEKSGLYNITEETINRELPIGSQFKFKDIRIYVLK